MGGSPRHCFKVVGNDFLGRLSDELLAPAAEQAVLEKGDGIMAQKNKEREGNGARGQSPATEQRNLPEARRPSSRLPSWTAEHPLTRLRDEMDALFNRFFGGWPTVGEQGWGPERLWDVDVEEGDKEILVRAEAPGFEPQDF